MDCPHCLKGFVAESYDSDRTGWKPVLRCLNCGRAPDDPVRVAADNAEIERVRNELKRALSGNRYSFSTESDPEVFQDELNIFHKDHRGVFQEKPEPENFPDKQEEGEMETPKKNNGYKPDELRSIRRKRLGLLLDRFGGSPKKLATRYPGIVWTTVDCVIKERYGMGDGNARKYEKIIGLRPNWFDEPGDDIPDSIGITSEDVPLPCAESGQRVDGAKEETARKGFSLNSRTSIDAVDAGHGWVLEIPLGDFRMDQLAQSLEAIGITKMSIYKK